MTPREREIMDLIRANPQISQQEIGEQLNIKRSSVAVHINHLVQKGYIIGRGYILQEEPYIVVVGGANVDLRGIPDAPLIMEDSNPGTLFQGAGGVGRNIGENLVRLGHITDMITILSDDRFGQYLLENGREHNLRYMQSFVLHGEKTPTYLEVLDEKGEMVVAISDMHLLEKLTPELLEKRKDYIENAILTVLDTNLTEESLEFLLTRGSGPFLVDGVSGAKVVKLRNLLRYIDLLKVNRREAEALLGRPLLGLEEVKKAAVQLVEQGTKKAVITCGKDGAVAYDGRDGYFLTLEGVEVINATGAGDAFTAGLVHGIVEEMSFIDSLKFAMGASKVTLGSEGANAIEMDEAEVLRQLGGISCVKY